MNLSGLANLRPIQKNKQKNPNINGTIANIIIPRTYLLSDNVLSTIILYFKKITILEKAINFQKGLASSIDD